MARVWSSVLQFIVAFFWKGKKSEKVSGLVTIYSSSRFGPTIKTPAEHQFIAHYGIREGAHRVHIDIRPKTQWDIGVPGDYWEIRFSIPLKFVKHDQIPSKCLGGEASRFLDAKDSFDKKNPGLYVSGSGMEKDNNGFAGQFAVHEFVKKDGELVAFAADFLQAGNNQPHSWYFASIRYNSAVPLTTKLPADLQVSLTA